MTDSEESDALLTGKTFKQKQRTKSIKIFDGEIEIDHFYRVICVIQWIGKRDTLLVVFHEHSSNHILSKP